MVQTHWNLHFLQMLLSLEPPLLLQFILRATEIKQTGTLNHRNKIPKGITMTKTSIINCNDIYELRLSPKCVFNF